MRFDQLCMNPNCVSFNDIISRRIYLVLVYCRKPVHVIINDIRTITKICTLPTESFITHFANLKAKLIGGVPHMLSPLPSVWGREGKGGVQLELAERKQKLNGGPSSQHPPKSTLVER